MIIIDAEDGEEFQSQNFEIFTFNQIVEAGRENPQPLPKINEDHILFINFTSGTTGMPKATMVSHKNMVSYMQCHAETGIFETDLRGANVFAFNPLAHILERLMLLNQFKFEMRQSIWCGDQDQFFKEIALTNPKIFVTVPRIWRKIQSMIKKELKNIPNVSEEEVLQAIEQKIKYKRETGLCFHKELDTKIFSHLSKILGNDVELVISAATHLDNRLKEFISVTLCVPFVEGWGMTEISGFGSYTRQNDPTPNIVGGPTPNFEFKLREVPDSVYNVSYRDENGNSRPRGEICFRGESVFEGYYQDPEATERTIDSEGWIHSGDIGELIPEKGAFKIIDRKKNIFYLASGASITPEIIESKYIQAPGLSEALITWNKDKSGLIGVFSFDMHQIPSLVQKIGIEEMNETNLKDFVRNPALREFYLNEFYQIHLNNNMKENEKLRDFRFVSNDFNSCGFMTSTHKIQRIKARHHLSYNNEVKDILV